MLIQSFELVVYMLRPGALKQRNSHLKKFLIQTKHSYSLLSSPPKKAFKRKNILRPFKRTNRYMKKKIFYQTENQSLKTTKSNFPNKNFFYLGFILDVF